MILGLTTGKGGYGTAYLPDMRFTVQRGSESFRPGAVVLLEVLQVAGELPAPARRDQHPEASGARCRTGATHEGLSGLLDGVHAVNRTADLLLKAMPADDDARFKVKNLQRGQLYGCR